MATTLAQQLQNISQAWGVSASQNQARGKPSLLFSPQEAAEADLHSIFGIGRQGKNPLRINAYQTARIALLLLDRGLSGHRAWTWSARACLASQLHIHAPDRTVLLEVHLDRVN